MKKFILLSNILFFLSQCKYRNPSDIKKSLDVIKSLSNKNKYYCSHNYRPIDNNIINTENKTNPINNTNVFNLPKENFNTPLKDIITLIHKNKLPKTLYLYDKVKDEILKMNTIEKIDNINEKKIIFELYNYENTKIADNIFYENTKIADSIFIVRNDKTIYKLYTEIHSNNHKNNNLYNLLMTLFFHHNSNQYPITWYWNKNTPHLGPKVFDHISTDKVDNNYTLDSPDLFKRYLNQSGEEKNPLSEKEEKIYNKLKSWENKVNNRFTFYIPPEQ